MAVYYCMLITSEFSSVADLEIKSFLQNTLGDVNYQSFIPYWKNTRQGELCFSFSSDNSLSEIHSLFANCWRDGCADARWSNIFCPMTVFIWLSQ